MDEQILSYAVFQLMMRTKPAAVESALIQRGLSIAEAGEVVQTAIKLKEDHFKKQGAKRMAGGSLAAVIGIALTFATYNAASGGGRYIVFTGLIAVGGAYALVGFVQHLTGWEIT